MVEADEKTIRQYLLGELDEAEISRFEERLMTDDELFEMLQVVEDDLLDEAAAGELSAAEQVRFDQHFLASPDRRARLKMSLALHDHARLVPEPVKVDDSAKAPELKKTDDSVVVDFPPAKPEPSPSFWSSYRLYFSVAAAAALLIAIGWGGWWIYSYYTSQSEVRRGLQALNQAYREQRPTEARLTEFDYAPLPVTRGYDSSHVDTRQYDRAGSLLLSALENHPDARTYHAAGLFYLAGRDFGRAIGYLEKALQMSGHNPLMESDLGAALLERGKAERDSNEVEMGHEDLLRSLEHLRHALELNDSLLAARFNYALCLEYLNRPQQAADEWRTYLDKDKNSPWREDAKQKLQALRGRGL
jgi:tetratricopeptide (TPR) repeat protein